MATEVPAGPPPMMIRSWGMRNLAFSSQPFNTIVILRVCDFFDVVKNRGCKQNSYDDKLVINSKKSQTLSVAKDPCICLLLRCKIHRSFASLRMTSYLD